LKEMPLESATVRMTNDIEAGFVDELSNHATILIKLDRRRADENVARQNRVTRHWKVVVPCVPG
jgi:hypothetical protein